MYYLDSGSLYGCLSSPNTGSEASGADELSCKECKNSEGVKNRCFDANNDNTCRLVGNGYARDSEGNCVSTQ